MMSFKAADRVSLEKDLEMTTPPSFVYSLQLMSALVKRCNVIFTSLI